MFCSRKLKSFITSFSYLELCHRHLKQLHRPSRSHSSIANVFTRVNSLVSETTHETALEEPVTIKDFPLHVSSRLKEQRQHVHLRNRLPNNMSMLRVRSAASLILQQTLQEMGFTQIHTPILTGNDCEGGSEIFQVESEARMQKYYTGYRSSVSSKDGPAVSGGVQVPEHPAVRHFFDRPVFLTVSGQLHLEVANSSLSRVFTFGPTFRAENQNSRLHLSEFYMAEIEMAFIDTIEELMDVAEKLIKDMTRQIIEHRAADITVVRDRHAPDDHGEIVDKLLNKNYVRMTFAEAFNLLEKHKEELTTELEVGKDLSREQELHLVQLCGDTPVFVTHHPAELKPFYAKPYLDGNTMCSMDLLMPGVGEVVGGTLREDRLDKLEEKMERLGLLENYHWYVDQRRFGSAPHGGFGLGFERYLQVILGVFNIRDVIPYPRFTHNCNM